MCYILGVHLFHLAYLARRIIQVEDVGGIH